jgi:hypothetical protein
MTQWSGGRGAFIVDRQTSKMNPEVEDHLSLRNRELWHRWKLSSYLIGTEVSKLLFMRSAIEGVRKVTKKRKSFKKEANRRTEKFRSVENGELRDRRYEVQ